MTLEEFARSKHPGVFERWDGARIEIEMIDDRIADEKSCTMTLISADGKNHAELVLNEETDEVKVTFEKTPFYPGDR